MADWTTDKPSKKQLNRLSWWAKRLNVSMPRPATKGEASGLIEQWLEEHPELDDEWQDEADRLRDADAAKEEFDGDLYFTCDMVDEWREFHNCNKVPQSVVTEVVKITGFRKPNEPIDVFTNRFFRELLLRHPELISKRKSKPHRHVTAGKGCLMILVVFCFVMLVTIVAIARKGR